MSISSEVIGLVDVVGWVVAVISIVLLVREREFHLKFWWWIRGKEKRSFRQACNAIDKLARMIRSRRFNVDCIIAIDGGGYVVAGMLAGELEKDLRPLKMVRNPKGEVKSVDETSLKALGDIANKDLLVVDDDSDTGNTLSVARDALQEHQAQVILAPLARRTDEQLNSDRDNYKLRPEDYPLWSWKTKSKVEMPWAMFPEVKKG